MKDINKRLRFLELYAAVSLVVFGVLILSGFIQTKQKFTEIDVERINLVEKNGQLRMVMANSEKMPDPVISGKAFKTERVPGMIFYNGMGDEDGGLIFGALPRKDGYGAYAGLLFDQYKQSQIVGIVYNDHSGSRQAGFNVWDRPEIPLPDLISRREEIDKMPDGEEKTNALAKWTAEQASPQRVFVGKNTDREAKVTLYDAKGKARINMTVSADGTPKLDFLDENGKVTYSLPKDAKR